MKDISVPIGNSDFREIREEGYYYIDKTGLIEELLHKQGTKITLITRPRRFGKSLGMSMLAHFFDIREDSRRLFEGLKVSGNKELCEKWQNQYPVLFLSFKDIDGLDFEGAKDMLRSRIFELCMEHSYLEKSEKVSEYARTFFSQMSDIVNGKMTDAQLKTSISLIIQMMQKYYGKQVILLID